MPLWVSLLLLGAQTPLGLCSHLAYPQALLCHHSRKGRRSSPLSLVHHSARSLHLLQTQSPGHCWGEDPEQAGALAKMQQPVFCSPKQMRIENGMLASTNPMRTGLFLEFSRPGSWGDPGARVGLRCKDLSLQESE